MLTIPTDLPIEVKRVLQQLSEKVNELEERIAELEDAKDQ